MPDDTRACPPRTPAFPAARAITGHPLQAPGPGVTPTPTTAPGRGACVLRREVTVALPQRVVIAFGVPGLANRYHSVHQVRCPDCPWSFLAAVEYGEPAGLLDVPAAQARLVAHARRSVRPHPKILGTPAPLPRSA
jgi:hypothetical protein